ncbi:G patch domain-containing protein 3-like [Lytechinus variegatus]|uniref:G patch domain-containing protein 3-like n=1 Tax=Lytechinus variegatus TaxID=7654 RepID=UPI001BB0FC80|nr:G patch domain-containing protein 3-like [Lytechinus variegatus]
MTENTEALAGAGSHAYGILANIPADFHSADLRNYFSQFIESNGFSCFHFRHRPETKQREKDDPSSYTSPSGKSSDFYPKLGQLEQSTSATFSAGVEDVQVQANNVRKTFCCVLKLEEHKMSKFIRMYHKKPWIDKKGAIMSSRCFISRIKVAEADGDKTTESGEAKEYTTRGDSKLIPPEREIFTESHLGNLVELNPPDLMPNGNVGTPTAVFLEYIRTCRLPPKVIQRLGLTFSKSRSNKRYGNVPFAYGGEIVDGVGENEEIAMTASGQEIKDNVEVTRVSADSKDYSRKAGRKKDRKKRTGNENEERNVSDSDEDDDDDTCEEWERHESLHEDITSQERTKERLFEEEIELKWEKGGSGLVFYTDAAFWDAQEGDFDEKTSDDWDVDMSIYYDEHGGDKDAKDSLDMRRMERMKRGLEDTSVFEKPIGQFEKHTKGIGRRVLQKQGWSEGEGLGKTVVGMADALDNTGQHSRDKTGFGYHGEKLQPTRSHVSTAKRQRRADKEVIISTIYDNPSVTDPAEPLMRSRGPYHLKYRHEVEFVKGDRR